MRGDKERQVPPCYLTFSGSFFETYTLYYSNISIDKIIFEPTRGVHHSPNRH